MTDPLSVRPGGVPASSHSKDPTPTAPAASTPGALDRQIQSGRAGWLHEGSRGEAVSELQSQLNLPVTGRFDRATHDAVFAFQTRQHIARDGIVGPETLRELRRTPASPSPQAATAVGNPPARRGDPPLPAAPTPNPTTPTPTAPAIGPTGPATTVSNGYDVATVTPQQLADLRASGSTGQRTANTIENARTNFGDTLTRGGRLVVSNPEGNGGQPVLTVVPPGFNPAQPARVHTHYHGWNGTVAEPRGSAGGGTVRIQEVQAADPQTVFVLPECSNTRLMLSTRDNASRRQYHTDWGNVSSQAATTDSALASAGISNVGTQVVSAHSAGGQALASALRHQPDGAGLRADRLELLDCLYGQESAIRGWADTDNGRAAQDVAFFRGTNDAGRDAHFGDASVFGSRFRHVDVGGPRANENPMETGSDGSSYRRYGSGPNAHNRAQWQFMDDGGHAGFPAGISAARTPNT